jgi:hypothetical protein
MADGNLSGDRFGSKIPVHHVDKCRTSFGFERLSYELELRLSDAFAGLAAFAGACRQAGLGLRMLRCGSDGRVICTLVETDTTDLAGFDRAIGSDGGIAVVRWTTMVDF